MWTFQLAQNVLSFLSLTHRPQPHSQRPRKKKSKGKSLPDRTTLPNWAAPQKIASQNLATILHPTFTHLAAHFPHLEEFLLLKISLPGKKFQLPSRKIFVLCANVAHSKNHICPANGELSTFAHFRASPQISSRALREWFGEIRGKNNGFVESVLFLLVAGIFSMGGNFTREDKSDLTLKDSWREEGGGGEGGGGLHVSSFVFVKRFVSIFLRGRTMALSGCCHGEGISWECIKSRSWRKFVSSEN